MPAAREKKGQIIGTLRQSRSRLVSSDHSSLQTLKYQEQFKLQSSSLLWLFLLPPPSEFPPSFFFYLLLWHYWLLRPYNRKGGGLRDRKVSKVTSTPGEGERNACRPTRWSWVTRITTWVRCCSFLFPFFYWITNPHWVVTRRHWAVWPPAAHYGPLGC